MKLKQIEKYIAREIFTSLPLRFQILSFALVKNEPGLAEETSAPLPLSTVESLLASMPPSVSESLQTYGVGDESTIPGLIIPVFQEYFDLATATPPPLDLTARASACEMCERDWVPLTYHHLIPRQVHAKVLKREWHQAWQLNSVAWLCRACHNFVHRIAGNEELAREWWTMELLMGREDVQIWAKWVSKLRWKGR